MPIKFPMPLAEIIWHDAETGHGWELHSEVDTKEELMITVGFIVARGETTVVVASSIDKESHCQSNSRIKIPIGMIKSVRELNVTYKKKKEEVSNEPTAIDTTEQFNSGRN